MAMCLEKCKHLRKEKDKGKVISAIQCTVCWGWYHDDCVGTEPGVPLGSWPCPTCRTIPGNINMMVLNMKTMSDSMGEMKGVMETLVKLVTDMKGTCDSTNAKLTDLQGKHDALAEENEQLKQSIQRLREQIDVKKQEVFTEGNCSHLVIGDSLLRSIDHNKLQNTVVKSMSGADTADVLHKVDELDDIYMDVTICVGTNDCNTNDDDFQPAAIADSYKQLVNKMAEKVDDVSKVTIVSVPPRADEPAKQERVKALNACLCALATETGAKFINNDPDFLLGNGSPNDGYLCRDGVHLNYTGTNRLAKNMKLFVKDGHNGNIYKDNRSGSWSNGSGNYTRPHNNNNRNNNRNNNSNYGNNHNRNFDGQRRPTGCCWNCGERNHNRNKCYYKGPVKCSKCNVLGHKAKLCNKQ